MTTDWGNALQVGGIGFTLVFAILIVLYFALALTGWLSVKYSPVKEKSGASKTQHHPAE
jgi:hypothetical protein